MSRDKKNILLVSCVCPYPRDWGWGEGSRLTQPPRSTALRRARSFQDLRYCLDESMSQLLGMSAPPRPGAEEQDSSARFTSSDGMYGGAGAGSNVMMMGGVPMGFMQQQGMAMQRAAMAAASGMATGAVPMMGSAPAPAGGHPEFGHAPHPPAMGMGHPAMGGGSGHPAMGGLMRSSSSGPVMGPGGMGMGPGGMGMGPSGVSDPLPRGYSQ